MKHYDDSDIRELLLCYEAPEPSPDLLERTKCLVHEEILYLETVPAAQERGVFIVVALAVAMTLCLFYMLTVGTILRFVLPNDLAVLLRHTFYALSAAGGSILACSLMIFIFKYLSCKRAEENLEKVRC